MTGMVKSVWVSCGVILLVVFLWAWYSIAADYGYKAVSGVYVLRVNGETSILVLKPDQTFQQELLRSGKTQHAEGSWRLFGEGHVAFSREFINIPGEELSLDGAAYAQVKKSFGIFLSIALDPNPGGPTYHKKLFD